MMKRVGNVQTKKRKDIERHMVYRGKWKISINCRSGGPQNLSIVGGRIPELITLKSHDYHDIML